MPRGIARDHALRRASIRKAAAEYFARHGFDRASMAGAARAAGVSKALIYHYWTGKEDLLFEILETHLSDLVAVADAAGGQGLRAMVQAILGAYRDADAAHKLQIDALGALPAERRAPLVALQRHLVAAMGAALSAEGEVPADRLRPVTMAVFGMLNWFYVWHRPGAGIGREAYGDLVTDLVLGGLGGIGALPQTPACLDKED